MNKTIKKDFINCENKEFVHYLIYLELKGKDINKSFGSGKKGFNKMMEKVFCISGLLKNKSKSMSVLKKPFPSVSDKYFMQILHNIEYKIKNT